MSTINFDYLHSRVNSSVFAFHTLNSECVNECTRRCSLLTPTLNFRLFSLLLSPSPKHPNVRLSPKYNRFDRFEMEICQTKTANERSPKQLLSHRRIKRSQGQELNLSPESICDRFSNPITSNKTFFSPSNGAENYPPNVDCILILEGMCVRWRVAVVAVMSMCPSSPSPLNGESFLFILRRKFSQLIQYL